MSPQQPLKCGVLLFFHVSFSTFLTVDGEVRWDHAIRLSSNGPQLRPARLLTVTFVAMLSVSCSSSCRPQSRSLHAAHVQPSLQLKLQATNFT